MSNGYEEFAQQALVSAQMAEKIPELHASFTKIMASVGVENPSPEFRLLLAIVFNYGGRFASREEQDCSEPTRRRD